METKKTTRKSEVKWLGREELSIQVQLDDQGVIQSSTVRGIGGPQFLKLIKKIRQDLVGSTLANICMPQGKSREDLCVREALLKLKGEWDFPYKEEELCHCRAVLTEVVDQAICAGAHTPKKVSAMTSASTACGTCRPEVETIIKYRLQS